MRLRSAQQLEFKQTCSAPSNASAWKKNWTQFQFLPQVKYDKVWQRLHGWLRLLRYLRKKQRLLTLTWCIVNLSDSSACIYQLFQAKFAFALPKSSTSPYAQIFCSLNSALHSIHFLMRLKFSVCRNTLPLLKRETTVKSLFSSHFTLHSIEEQKL